LEAFIKLFINILFILVSTSAYSEEFLEITNLNLQGVWEFHPTYPFHLSHEDVKSILFTKVEPFDPNQPSSTLKKRSTDKSSYFFEFVGDVIYYHQFSTSNDSLVSYFQTPNPYTLNEDLIQINKEQSIIVVDLMVLFVSKEKLVLYVEKSGSLLSFKKTTKEAITETHH